MGTTTPGSSSRRGGRPKKQRGMTLIEVMVGALLLLFAMAGIVPLFLTGLSQASSIRLKSIATNVAREKMEQIRQLDYREIYDEDMAALDPSLGDRTLENLFGVSETVRDTTFTIEYVVHESAYGEGKLKEVTVNVTWEAPPPESPASITTLIHQQFLGPRGSRLTVDPTHADPLGTPFPLLGGATVARYYIAQADWSLVFYDLDAADPTARDIYVRLAFFDDTGQTIPLGDAGQEYKIGKSYIKYTRGDDGKIDAVWFEYPFDSSILPDGYWELRAVAYNTYNEPGNTWRLRVRVETGAPAAPSDFTATPQGDYQTVILNWAGGQERDRAHYVLERRRWDPYAGLWLPWVTLVDNLDPKASQYRDTGDVASQTDPWGTPSVQNVYEYSLWAVDICQPGLAGPPAVVSVAIAPVTTTTTLLTTTTTVASTTTTAPAFYSVDIKNSSSSKYNIRIQNEAGRVVYAGQVLKGRTITVSICLRATT
jgi:type II secretory pathway pseudopilin PulG